MKDVPYMVFVIFSFIPIYYVLLYNESKIVTMIIYCRIEILLFSVEIGG
jgi:hypothetical protein